MTRPRPLKALFGYYRDALDLDGARRRKDDIKALGRLLRHGPSGPIPLLQPSKALRASALATYIYSAGAALAYAGVLWQIMTLSSSPVVTGAWMLAAGAFSLQGLAAAARHWRLRTGRSGGITGFLDSEGPHWPRLRG